LCYLYLDGQPMKAGAVASINAPRGNTERSIVE
jgi:hypothetical protein